MKLYATPLSHFARKNRILLRELELSHEIVYVENLLSSNAADFGGNPILRIPTLVDGEQFVVESDQIARYLVESYDAQDRFGVLSLTPDQRNLLSMISAAMGAEVEILLSGRSGIAGVESIPYFQRYFEVIRLCLAFLEKQGPDSWTRHEFSYLDIALTCMWDPLAYYGTIPELENHVWLKKRAASFEARSSCVESAPKNQGVTGPMKQTRSSSASSPPD
ncbi:MAG: glutathione S-transferase family protein [Planctomycetota bacterium]